MGWHKTCVSVTLVTVKNKSKFPVFEGMASLTLRTAMFECLWHQQGNINCPVDLNADGGIRQ